MKILDWIFNFHHYKKIGLFGLKQALFRVFMNVKLRLVFSTGLIRLTCEKVIIIIIIMIMITTTILIIIIIILTIIIMVSIVNSIAR